MDIQHAINFFGGLCITCFSWFASQIWESHKTIQKSLKDIEVDIPKTYVRRDEFLHQMKKIEDLFTRIYDKIDNKADKH